MTSKKTTKRALLTSVIALLLCCSMLIGTTYAWFTDSVTSGVNQIVAGNLDIELYYATPGDVDDSGNIPEEAWTKVTADAPVFNKDALWEPGYTEVVYLKAVNLGTLSLRYHMNVRIVDEISGTNKAGKTFNLSDYIQAYAIQAADYQFMPLTSRQMASDPLSLNIGAPDPFSDTLANATQGDYDGFETGVYDSLSLNLSQWLEPEEEWYTTLVLFMPSSVGNEANYMTGTTPPQINLGLNVVATQYDWEPEKDSFDENYDEGLNPEYTYVWSVQDLKNAMLTRGAKIALAEDISIEADTPLQWGSYMFVANGREVTIDLNGHNIVVEEDASLKVNGLFTTANGGTLNIVGEGTVEVKNGQSGIFHAMNKNDQINVYGGTYISNSDNGSDALAIIYTNSGNVDVYGGKFIPADGVTCANAEDRQGDRLSIVFHEGALLKHDKYYDGYDATRIQLQVGCKLEETIIDGETWYKVTYITPVNSSAELAAAIEAGETIINLADGTYQMPHAAQGKTLTINGSHNAVIEVVPAGQGEANGQLDYSLDGSKVTFNGVTIKTNSQLYAGFARLSATYNNCVIQNTYNLGTGTSVFNNCTFNITNEYLRVGGATKAVFNGCTFNTDGRAILIFQDGTSVAQTVTVKNCTFNATAAANTWNGIHVAAVSYDGSRGGTYTVNFEGNNVVDSDFNGLWQIKAGEANVTVNGLN